MASRSLNKAQLIGNLTRDPELRYTPQGTAVCTLGLATNRTWTTESGEKKEAVEFHRIVAWNKLAELCSQLLFKGRRIYVEGRLQTRQWESQDGSQRQSTEIVIDEMIILDSRRAEGGEMGASSTGAAPATRSTAGGVQVTTVTDEKPVSPKPEAKAPAKAKSASSEKKEEVKEEIKKEEVSADDIPF